MEKYLVGFFILVITIIIINLDSPATTALAKEEELPTTNLIVPQPIQTESRFTQKLEGQTIILPRKIVEKNDPEMEIGEEKVLEEGSDGKKERIIKITFFESEEYEREIVSEENTAPKDKIVLKGTKIVWRTLNTADGEIRYWRKMRVYATHYDFRCRGCDEWTAIGMRAGKGVIAVDPKVIKLRSQVYIPGYGKAVAGDTGGAIKGNIIDLGFDDAKTAGWSARFVDIYLL